MKKYLDYLVILIVVLIFGSIMSKFVHETPVTCYNLLFVSVLMFFEMERRHEED